MSTRAIYRFKDKYKSITVYKHHDNYPSGALWFIQRALEYAWELPRFEADEFAAAFVAANKGKGGGNIRLGNFVMDEEFNYEISIKNDELWIKCTQGGDAEANYDDVEPLFEGTLQDFWFWVDSTKLNYPIVEKEDV